MSSRLPRLLALLAYLSVAAGALHLGCAFAPDLSEPSQAPESDPGSLVGHPNWPIPPGEAEALLREPHHDIRLVERTAAGTSGAEKIVVYSPKHGELTFKAKRVPDMLDGVNNSPRKELAAYEVQKLFLDPEDYVVPTTLVRCQTIDVWHRHHADAHPQLPEASCVLVVVSVWLEGVTLPDPLHDRERFETDATYAHYLSDFNLLTYLIDHRDGRTGNFLVAEDDARRHVFAIDNGISFDPMVFNYFVSNWNAMRVGALRRESIRRLRALERRDLNALLVVQELHRDGSGHYVDAPESRLIDVHHGVGASPGVIQFGLTKHEIESLWRRIQAILARVDRNAIELF